MGKSHSDVHDVSTSDIAIVGMSCRVPGANDVEQFWANLVAGRESIAQLSDEELRAAGVEEELLQNPSYIKVASKLEGIEQFDAAFFGFNTREAQMTDPQQRLFLEAAWQALENAGYARRTSDHLIGVPEWE
jgi:acyl transferase domain-containing protein